ncbi:MAG: DinB family protein [Bacillota bacterium]
MTKDQLLERLRGERAQVMAVLESATEEELHDAPPGRWSVAEVLRHLMVFERDVINGIDDLDAGNLPAWTRVSDWNLYNTEQAALWKDQPIADIRQAFAAHRAKLVERVEAIPDAKWASNPGYARFISPAGLHDFEHLPGILERLARTRGDYRAAAVHYAEIGRNELLALVFRLPEEAFDERVEGKWSIKEILLHLAARDRRWATSIRAVTNGEPAQWSVSPEELEETNLADVKATAHYPVPRVLYELGEARGLWVGAMLKTPDSVGSEALQRWAFRRLEHDRHHLTQIVERWTNYRKRSKG